MRATAGESAAPTTSAATSIGTMRRGRAAILEGESNRLHAFDHLHRQLRGSKWPPRCVGRHRDVPEELVRRRQIDAEMKALGRLADVHVMDRPGHDEEEHRGADAFLSNDCADRKVVRT